MGLFSTSLSTADADAEAALQRVTASTSDAWRLELNWGDSRKESGDGSGEGSDIDGVDWGLNAFWHAAVAGAALVDRPLTCSMNIPPKGLKTFGSNGGWPRTGIGRLNGSFEESGGGSGAPCGLKKPPGQLFVWLTGDPGDSFRSETLWCKESTLLEQWRQITSYSPSREM